MNCLVTGGAGFIGSNLLDALIDRGDRVTVIDNLTTGRRENLEAALDAGAELHECDICDAGAVRAALEAARPEVVFHLAGQVDVRYSTRQPARDARTNVLGLITVLEASRAVGVRRLINGSTGGALYGDADRIPTTEESPIRPLAPYGQAKYAAEGYCDLYQRTHGLSTLSLRYSNVYGPRQDPTGEAGVVAIFCGSVPESRRPTVFGDGRQTRDLVEVSDVVRANLLAAQSPLTGAVNISSGTETSVLELIATLNEVSDHGELGAPVFAPARPGEVRRSCLDNAKARRELGWEPAVELADGLRRILGGMPAGVGS